MGASSSSSGDSSSSSSSTGSGGSGGGTPGPMLLDPTFGSNGIATVGPKSGNGDYAQAVARQPDGKIIVAGTTNQSPLASSPNASDLLLTRFGTDGKIDATFGMGGKVLVSIGLYSLADGVHVQADQKILVLARYNTATPSTSSNLCLARFMSNGALDASFGQGGILDVKSPLASNSGASIGANGKVLVRGKTLDNKPALALLLPDGSVDPSFGTAGVQTLVSEISGPLVMQADGKILMAYTTGTGAAEESRVMRLLANGAVDMAFGTMGEAAVSLGTDAEDPQALAVRDDGSLLVGGKARVVGMTVDEAVLLALDSKGAVDTTFGGGDGMTRVDWKVSTQINRIVIDDQKRIVTRAWHDTGAGGIMRFSPDGTLDAGFGMAGMAKTDIANGVGPVVAPNGDVSLAGILFDFGQDTSDVAVARVTSAGQLDTAFGANGYARFNSGATKEVASHMLIEPDGKIVGAGLSLKSSILSAWMVRQLPNGGIDTSFGTDGWVKLANPALVQGLARTADGHLLALTNGQATQYDASGQLDTSFGTNGSVTSGFGGNATALALDAAGQVLIGGKSTGCSFGLVRATKTGQLDTTFDGDGTVVTTLESGNFCGVRAIAVQSDGKILAAGRGGTLQGNVIARYETNGALDMTFGQAGLASAAVAGAGGFDLDQMALLPDGKILVAGFQFGPTSSWIVVRLNASGQIDTSFGNGGVMGMDSGAIASIGTQYAGPGLAVLSDGSVLVGGSTNVGLYEKMLAWKLQPDGTVDPMFGHMGKAIVPAGLGTFSAYAIGVQPDGKIVLGGRGFSPETGTDFGFVRLAP